MTTPSSVPHAPLLTLLRGVSRSFYLSMRLLPRPLRQPVAVGYLLARATDTIADTAELPGPERLQRLDTLAAAIQGEPGPGRDLAGLAASFARLQADPAEQRLILALPACLQWLDELAPADAADVRAVVATITRGQSLDVQRFGDAGPVRALANAQELRDYTWLVAGCVGEFWTQLCLRHLPDFATLPAEGMLALGRRYGMGLQLVNILRDAPDDLAAGRCYLPADQLAAAGITPQALAQQPHRFGEFAGAWHVEADRLLESGMRYALAVRSRRVRAASALPALIGARTLALLREQPLHGPQGRVKVPRREVRALLVRTLFSLASPASLEASYQRLRAAPADHSSRT